MADTAHGLYVKYGLGHRPTEDEVGAWWEAADALISQGVALEEAGQRAAETVFPDYRTYFYKSEADTIEMLLMRAKDK